jgi:hypothetical protein
LSVEFAPEVLADPIGVVVDLIAERKPGLDLVQHDQQVTDRAGGGRAAVIEHSWPVEQGLGESAAFDPAVDDHARGRGDRRRPGLGGGSARRAACAARGGYMVRLDSLRAPGSAANDDPST